MSLRSSMKSKQEEDIARILGTIPPDKVFTQMKNLKDGILISISNLGGCPKENYKGDDITQTPCKNSFYQAIGKFLRKNSRNRVVFMGNFFGNGPYSMTMIHNIMILYMEFNYSNGQPKTLEGENQVEVVLGEKDINLLQLKYCLHKFLLRQDVEHPEIGIEMPSVIKFTDKESRKQGKAYGNYIPYNHMIRKDFSNIYTQVLVNSIYQRVKNIIQTCGCFMPYCLLFDSNFNEFHYLAKNEQNIELMLLIEQLSVFTLTYSFVPDGVFEKHISSVEIFNIIEFILDQINRIIEELRTHRTDIYVRQMGEIYQRMVTLIADPKTTDTFIEELMPLKNWKNTLMHFYNNAKLIHYDRKFKSVFVQFDPTYSLPLFIHCFGPFAEYVRQDKKNRYTYKPPKGEIWSIENYYKNFSNIYEDFLCQKIVYNICNPKNHPYEEYVELKGKKSADNNNVIDTTAFLNNKILTEVNDSQIGNMDGGSLKKTQKKYKKRNKRNNKVGKTLKIKRHWKSLNTSLNNKNVLQEGGDSKSVDDDMSFNTYFDGIQFDEKIDITSRLYNFNIAKSHYKSLRLSELFLNINRYYRSILKYPAKLQNDTELNQFIYLQVFYLFLRKNKGRISPLNGKHIRKNKELYELFKLKRIYNIFVANLDFNLHFSLPLINIYGVTFIILDKLIEVKKKFDTPRKGKFLHDSYEEYQPKELLKLYNYPITAINNNGMIENTALTITGNIKIKKVYLGPYFFHTFNNFFLLHEALTDVNLREYKADFAINPEGDYLKLEAYMLPPLITDNLGEDPHTFFMDNIYFIKIMPDVKALNEYFLILDLEKCIKGGKVGYYLGKITQWMGFFWNTKIMYHRTMVNIPQVREGFDNYIENYLPALTTDRLYLPFEEKLDIKLKDEPSILDIDYKFDSRLSKENFISANELARKVEKPKKQIEDNRLSKLKHTFDTLFGIDNFRLPPYTLDFDKLELAEEFKTGLEMKIKKAELNVTVPVNNVEALLEEKSIGKGAFKEIYGYNKKLQDPKKYRYVIAKEKSENLSDSYYQELSILLFLSFPSKKYGKYSNRINPCLGLNIYEDHFYYITPKSNLGNLSSILNNHQGKINGNNYFFEGGKINNKNLYNLILNLVEGLLFLEDKKIIHLDLFFRNIICYVEENNIIFKIIDFGFSEVNKSALMLKGTETKTKAKISVTSPEGEDTLDSSRIDAQQSKVKILRDLDLPSKMKKDIVCNHILKRIPIFSCPLGRSDEFKLMGSQSDIWNLGFIFLSILGVNQGMRHNTSCFTHAPNKSKEKKQVSNIMKLINLYNPEDKNNEGDLYLDLLYHMLINKIETTNFLQKPELQYEELNLFTTPNLSEIQEKASDIKGKSISITAQVIQRNSIDLVFVPNKKLDYCVNPEVCKFLNMCYTSFGSRLEASKILKELEGPFQNFKNMGDFISKKEIILSGAPTDAIIQGTEQTPITKLPTATAVESQAATAPAVEGQAATATAPPVKGQAATATAPPVKGQEKSIVAPGTNNRQKMMEMASRASKTQTKEEPIGDSKISDYLDDSNNESILEQVIKALPAPQTSDLIPPSASNLEKLYQGTYTTTALRPITSVPVDGINTALLEGKPEQSNEPVPPSTQEIKKVTELMTQTYQETEPPVPAPAVVPTPDLLKSQSSSISALFSKSNSNSSNQSANATLSYNVPDELQQLYQDLTYDLNVNSRYFLHESANFGEFIQYRQINSKNYHQYFYNYLTAPDGNCGYHAIIAGLAYTCYRLVLKYLVVEKPFITENMTLDKVEPILNNLCSYENLFKFIASISPQITVSGGQLNQAFQATPGAPTQNNIIYNILNTLSHPDTPKIHMDKYYVNLLRTYMIQKDINYYEYDIATQSFKPEKKTFYKENARETEVKMPDGSKILMNPYKRVSGGITQPVDSIYEFEYPEDFISIKQIFNIDILMVPQPYIDKQNKTNYRFDGQGAGTYSSFFSRDGVTELPNVLQNESPIIFVGHNGGHYEFLIHTKDNIIKSVNKTKELFTFANNNGANIPYLLLGLNEILQLIELQKKSPGMNPQKSNDLKQILT